MDDRAIQVLNDAAAHLRVISQQLELSLSTIAQRYPNNTLGGQVQRLNEIAVFAAEQAVQLSGVADEAMLDRPEMRGGPREMPLQVPKEVERIFEYATVITHFLVLEEAAQLAEAGKLVVIRDRTAQAMHMVQRGTVVFDPEVDELLVRLWWPRLFSRDLSVSLIPTSVPGVYKETTMQAEDLPGA